MRVIRAALVGVALVASVASMAQTMVIINGQSIARDQFVKRMQVLPGVGRMLGGDFQSATPGYLTMQQMMNELLVIQVATEKGVAPTDAQVDAEVKRRLEGTPDLLEAFKILGLTEADLRHEIRVEMSEYNILTMGVTVTNQEIEAYYKGNPTAFTIPKRLRLRMIAVTNDDDRKKVDGELLNGSAFGDVAEKYSVDPSKFAKGLMGDVPVSQLGPEAKPVLENAEPGFVTQWIRGNMAAVKFLVEAVMPEEVIPLNEEQTRRIRNQLMLNKGRQRNDLPKMLEEARAKARVQWQGTPFDLQLQQLFGPQPVTP